MLHFEMKMPISEDAAFGNSDSAETMPFIEAGACVYEYSRLPIEAKISEIAIKAYAGSCQ